MRDRKVKKGKNQKDINSFSNTLGRLADDYQQALNRQTAVFEKAYQAPPAQPKDKQK